MGSDHPLWLAIGAMELLRLAHSTQMSLNCQQVAHCWWAGVHWGLWFPKQTLFSRWSFIQGFTPTCWLCIHSHLPRQNHSRGMDHLNMQMESSWNNGQGQIFQPVLQLVDFPPELKIHIIVMVRIFNFFTDRIFYWGFNVRSKTSRKSSWLCGLQFVARSECREEEGKRAA